MINIHSAAEQVSANEYHWWIIYTDLFGNIFTYIYHCLANKTKQYVPVDNADWTKSLFYKQQNSRAFSNEKKHTLAQIITEFPVTIFF